MRKGFIDYEWATIFMITVMFFATLYSVFRLWTVESAPENPNLWMESCQNCLDQMNTDFKFAASLKASPDAIELANSDGKVVTYRVSGDSLKRIEAGGNETVLLQGLQSGKFFPDTKMKGFLSVVFLPNNKMALPFFTSFAARGLKNP